MKTLKNYFALFTLALLTICFACDETKAKKTETADGIAMNDSKNKDINNLCREVEVAYTAKDEMHMLYYDCSLSGKYQDLHIDVKNSFGILGKLKVNPKTGAVDDIKIRLKEAGNCKRYFISEAKYYPSSETISDFEHNLVLKLEERAGRNISDSIPVIGNMGTVANGEILDVHFVINDGELMELPRVKVKDSLGKVLFERVDKVITYGQQYCKSKILLN